MARMLQEYHMICTYLKMSLQIIYNLGIEKKTVPRIPGFTIMFYAFCTAVLFHAGILEPRTLRPSYYKFLQAISGER